MDPQSAEAFPELGFYGLAGHSDSPRDLIDEIHRADDIGLGAVFLSERFNFKDAAVMAGMAAAASERIGIATAATNSNTRHPLITATMAATMHRATEGRYALGIGRGHATLHELMGVPKVTNAQLTDAFDIYRRLWRGEQFAYDGPVGTFPFLFTLSPLDERIPLMMMAIGPKSMEHAARIADSVLLHTFMSDEAVARAVERIRSTAEQAGRDPSSVRIWACTAVIDDDAMDEETRLRKTVGRLATYLQAYGDTLVAINEWDPRRLAAFREDPKVASFEGAFDAVGTTEDLEYLREKVIPAEWLAAHIGGTARSCAQQVVDQFAATGVDSIVMHGVNPAQLANVVKEYRSVRDPQMPVLPANPGWTR